MSDQSIKTSASPKVRKFARELGVDINSVKGSERLGRIVEKDLKEFVSTNINQTHDPKDSKNENIFYYITTMNENYSHPEMPKDCEDGILKGMYKIKESSSSKEAKIQLLGSGTILREMMAASDILKKEYQVDSEVWSVTSFNELRKNGIEVERQNLLNPSETNKKSYIEECLGKQQGPILAATDYMRINADQIRSFTKKSFYSLGTDGYGRSDTRKNLRSFFEVDKEHIVAYSLSVLAKEQLITSKYAEDAIKKYNIDKNKPMPTKM